MKMNKQNENKQNKCKSIVIFRTNGFRTYRLSISRSPKSGLKLIPDSLKRSNLVSTDLVPTDLVPTPLVKFRPSKWSDLIN